MKLKTTILSVLITCAGLAAASAQTTVSLWTAAGGAFTPASQPGYTAGVGGTLTPDSGSAPASLVITGATSGGLYSDYFYSLFSTPAVTLAADTLAGVSTITLEIVTGGFAFGAAPALDFGSETNWTVSATTEPAGNTGFGELTRYTYVWDVSSVVASGSSFAIDWTLNNHAPIAHVSLTQTGSSVPEPASFAALAGLGVLGAAAARRRRRA